MEADVENYPGMYLLKGTSSSTASGVFSSDASTDYSIHAAFPPYPLKEEIGGYARLNLVPTERANYIAEKVTKLPWRIVLVTDEDKQLVGNDIAKVLGPACRVKDTSWIKPGKVAWDWWNNTNITGVDFRAGINTETYKYFVDLPGTTIWNISSSTKDGVTRKICWYSPIRWIWQASSIMPKKMEWE